MAELYIYTCFCLLLLACETSYTELFYITDTVYWSPVEKNPFVGVQESLECTVCVCLSSCWPLMRFSAGLWSKYYCFSSSTVTAGRGRQRRREVYYGMDMEPAFSVYVLSTIDCVEGKSATSSFVSSSPHCLTPWMWISTVKGLHVYQHTHMGWLHEDLMKYWTHFFSFF